MTLAQAPTNEQGDVACAIPPEPSSTKRSRKNILEELRDGNLGFNLGADHSESEIESESVSLEKDRDEVTEELVTGHQPEPGVSL